MAITDSLWEAVSQPYHWPRTVRRLVVVTFPISVPLWGIALLVAALLKTLATLMTPIRNFWNAPQQRPCNYSDYGSPQTYQSTEFTKYLGLDKAIGPSRNPSEP